MKKNLLSLLLLSIMALTSAFAQNRTVTGIVTGTEDGVTLPGVTVRVKGSTTAVTTNADGRYSINAPRNATTLVFTFIGYSDLEAAIPASGQLNVKLATNNKALDEVVVVGYQTLKRSDVVGAVSTVAGKELEAKPIPSFTQLLQGTATGVQVTGASGRPGNNGVIRVRGTGSIIASAEPLIVIDDIQVSSSAFSALNPDDIETVTILKDASAIAIYGSRGSNGVVLVTTKTGKPSQPTVSYTFRFGKSDRQPLKNVQLMNSAQKFDYEYAFGYTNPTLDSMITKRVSTGALPAGSNLFNLTSTQRQGLYDLAASRGAGDWAKYLFQTATMRTHQINISGGADKLTYFLSGSINDNPGIERFSEFNRKGGRLNVTYQVKPWFKMGSNIGVTTSHDNRLREAYNTQNSGTALYFFNPYEQPYNNDGSYNTTAQGFSPLEGAVNNPVTYDRINNFGTFFGEARFVKHLTLKSLYAVNYNQLKYQSYLQPGSNLAGILGYNQKQDQNTNDFFYSFTNTANWNQTIASKHTINALIGTEYDKSNVYTLSATGRNFPSKTFTTLENAATPFAATSSITEFSLISYFTSLAYDYDKRYFITASGRRDGSSRFGANVKFANFGAIGLAWDLKNEKFFKLPQIISDLKLRGSIGTSGNNTIPEYQALGVYSITGKYNDQTAATPLRLANPNLTWETSLSKDVGLTYGLLDSRITGEIDYYNRVNKNLLYTVNVSQTTGFSSYLGNVGAVRNRGVEFSVNGDVIRNKDLRFSLNFMYSHNDNAVTQIYVDNVAGQGSSGIQRLKIGQPINTFFLVNDLGVDPADGKEIYGNLDGSTTKTYSAGQAAILDGKSPNVKYFGTFGTNVSYKGFDLGVKFYYSGGNWIYNQVRMDETSSSDYNINLFTEAANFWKQPGDVAMYPNIKDPTQQAENYTTKFLEKGDYVSLRDVTLGYTLKNRYTEKLGIGSIRLYAQGTNLYLWTKYKGNPEFAEAGESTSYAGSLSLYGYPPIRGYTFGIDVRF